MKQNNLFFRIVFFYIDGFRNLSDIGKKLWLIIIIKIIVIFVVMKFIFFQDFLTKNFDTDEKRSNYVLENLTKK